jgi:hypothetical protein
MVNRVLMWTTAGPRLQQQVTENPITRRAAHRFLAGERLDEALVADYAPPSTTATRTWGAGAVPASGHAAESTARPSGAGDASIARAHRAPTEHRSR